MITTTLDTVQQYKRKVEAILGGPKCFRKSALNIRDGGGVFETVLGGYRRYPWVLEIGTHRGIATGFIAQFCEKVITIDLEHGQLEQLGEPVDRYVLWNALGVGRKIDFIRVKDNDDKKRVIDKLIFDLAFIDGGKTDIAEDFASCRKCGAILMHDHDPSNMHPGKRHVVTFVQTLPRDEVEFMDIFCFWHGKKNA